MLQEILTPVVVGSNKSPAASFKGALQTYTFLEDYKYVSAITWANSATYYGNDALIDNVQADNKITQNNMTCATFYNVKRGQVFSVTNNVTFQLVCYR